ncbi:MAG: glycosyl hydrolase, partial [Flavobacteriaceae bacterium]
METKLTQMHDMVNLLYKAKDQIESTISKLDATKHKDVIEKGQQLVKDLTAWDEDMIQRKSKAYDDVENFPNKFTAEYIFLINQTESSIPRVNDQNKKRKVELESQWNSLKSRGNIFINTEIPNFNKQLWDAGIGAIKMTIFTNK